MRRWTRRYPLDGLRARKARRLRGRRGKIPPPTPPEVGGMREGKKGDRCNRGDEGDRMNGNFGRLVAKDRSYEGTFPFRMMAASSARTVERVLTLPLALRRSYDQGALGACVGFSTSWMMSIYNCIPQQKYDAVWLYRQSQLNDNDPYTEPPADTGSYVWAAFYVLNHFGHKKTNEAKPDEKDGVVSYYWGRSANDARTAIALGRPVVIGVNWYESFMAPRTIKGEYWIGAGKDMGSSLGGHAICIYGASDKRQAVKLVNSWGLAYPQVWMPYTMLDRLMSEEGEMCMAVDRKEVT